jgi:hypothetical protein
VAIRLLPLFSFFLSANPEAEIVAQVPLTATGMVLAEIE